MRKIKGLSIHVAAAMALATMFGTSAFADNRHPQTTQHGRSGSDHRSESRQGRHESSRQQGASRQSFSHGERFNSGSQRSFQQRDRAFEERGRQSESFRGRDVSRDAVRRDFARDNGFRGNDRGRILEGGRINRILHERGGYRVWLDRGRFSYFVPEARFRLFPLRVGLSIRFGGFYDPLGYVNVYDIYPYDYAPAYGGSVYVAPGYGAPAYGAPAVAGLIRGVVDSVDYRRGTVVLTDDGSGQLVTVTMSGRDRRFDDLRPGDWVELSGDFDRSGYFNAYRVENFRAGHY